MNREDQWLEEQYQEWMKEQLAQEAADIEQLMEEDEQMQVEQHQQYERDTA